MWQHKADGEKAGDASEDMSEDRPGDGWQR